MIGVGDWLGGIIRPSWPNVVKVQGRGLSRVLASLRRPQGTLTGADTIPRPMAEVGHGVSPSPGSEDHERDRSLMRLLRERWPHVKIIIASGYPQQALQGEPADLSEFDFVGKPYRLADLARHLRAAGFVTRLSYACGGLRESQNCGILFHQRRLRGAGATVRPQGWPWDQTGACGLSRCSCPMSNPKRRR